MLVEVGEFLFGDVSANICGTAVGVRALSSGVEVEGVVEDGRHAADHET